MWNSVVYPAQRTNKFSADFIRCRTKTELLVLKLMNPKFIAFLLRVLMPQTAPNSAKYLHPYILPSFAPWAEKTVTSDRYFSGIFPVFPILSDNGITLYRRSTRASVSLVFHFTGLSWLPLTLGNSFAREEVHLLAPLRFLAEQDADDPFQKFRKSWIVEKC